MQIRILISSQSNNKFHKILISNTVLSRYTHVIFSDYETYLENIPSAIIQHSDTSSLNKTKCNFNSFTKFCSNTP